MNFDFIDFNLKKKTLFYDIRFYLLCAMIYYIFLQLDQEERTSLLLLFCFIFFTYVYNKGSSLEEKTLNLKDKEKTHEFSNDEIKDISTPHYNINKVPDKYKSLHRYPKLMQLYEEYIYIFKRDKDKQRHLITYLDKFCKYYMNLLIGRYNTNEYFPMLIDIRRNILNILMSYYFVIPYYIKPHDYKHIYKKELNEGINIYKAYMKEMIETIVEKYDLNMNGYLNYQNPLEHNRLEDKFEYY
jgi:hypothetical protein